MRVQPEGGISQASPGCAAPTTASHGHTAAAPVMSTPFKAMSTSNPAHSHSPKDKSQPFRSAEFTVWADIQGRRSVPVDDNMEVLIEMGWNF